MIQKNIIPESTTVQVELPLNYVGKKVNLLFFVEADLENGFATLQLPFGKKIQINGSSEFLVLGDWGVKYGVIIKNGKESYENIQLLRKGLVVEYLDISKFINT